MESRFLSHCSNITSLPSPLLSVFVLIKLLSPQIKKLYFLVVTVEVAERVPLLILAHYFWLVGSSERRGLS